MQHKYNNIQHKITVKLLHYINSSTLTISPLTPSSLVSRVLVEWSSSPHSLEWVGVSEPLTQPEELEVLMVCVFDYVITRLYSPCTLPSSISWWTFDAFTKRCRAVFWIVRTHRASVAAYLATQPFGCAIRIRRTRRTLRNRRESG